MPIYEYRCTACENLFEEWVKSFDSPEHEPCPQCGGDAVRVISRTTFVLEGAGWYVTEYGNRKTNHESGAGAPSADDAPSDAATEKAEVPASEAPPAAPASEPASSPAGSSSEASSSTTAA